MKIKKILIKIFIIFLFFGMIIGICYFESKEFNSGYCINCNTKYNALSRTKNGQTYYECPNCYYGCYY